MTQEELSKAVSLVQMLPIRPGYPKQQAVSMVRVFHCTVRTKLLSFVSLHPGLKIYSYAPVTRAA